MNRLKLGLFLLGLLLICSCGGQNRSKDVKAQQQNQLLNGAAGIKSNSYKPGEVLIRFKKGTSPSEIEDVQNRLGLKKIRQLAAPNLFLMKIQNNVQVLKTVEKLMGFERVLYAEPNYMIELIEPENPQSHVSGEILVRFKDHTDESRLRTIQKRLHLKIIQTFSLPNLYLMQIMGNKSVKETMENLYQYDEILYAEPNYVHKLDQ